MDQDGYIKKKEMVTMLYNYPKTHIKFITDEIAPDNGEKLNKMTEKRVKSIHNIEDNCVMSQNNFDSPCHKAKGGTLQSVHSDNLDGVLNDELEVASNSLEENCLNALFLGEDKIHSNFYYVERDINKSFQYNMKRENEIKTNIQQANPEQLRTKPKRGTTHSISLG